MDDEGVDVEDEGGDDGAVIDTGEEGEEGGEDDAAPVKPSTDVDTVVLFTKPPYPLGSTPGN